MGDGEAREGGGVVGGGGGGVVWNEGEGCRVVDEYTYLCCNSCVRPTTTVPVFVWYC